MARYEKSKEPNRQNTMSNVRICVDADVKTKQYIIDLPNITVFGHSAEKKGYVEYIYIYQNYPIIAAAASATARLSLHQQ